MPQRCLPALTHKSSSTDLVSSRRERPPHGHREREEIRRDRRRERKRDWRTSRAAPHKRSKLQRDEDRDVCEVIALGLPNPRKTNEVQYDQRLSNQSKGLDSGFADGEDTLFKMNENLSRYDKDMASIVYGHIRNSYNRPSFPGVDHGQGRVGPVQFVKDPFKDKGETKKLIGLHVPSTKRHSKDDYPDTKRRKQ